MKIFTTILLLALGGLAAHAQDEEPMTRELAYSDFVPARFTGGPQAVAAKIPFPKHKKDISLLLYCDVQVYEGGDTELNRCMSDHSKYEKFWEAADRVIQKEVLQPARVRGKAEHVTLYYRVWFMKKDGQSQVHVLPNWGYEAADYGHFYDGPQLIGRLGAVSSEANVVVGTPCPINVRAMSTVKVGINGKPDGEARFDPVGSVYGSTDSCADYVTNRVENCEFIPAHVNDRPVPAQHVAVWGEMKGIVLGRN